MRLGLWEVCLSCQPKEGNVFEPAAESHGCAASSTAGNAQGSWGIGNRARGTCWVRPGFVHAWLFFGVAWLSVRLTEATGKRAGIQNMPNNSSAVAQVLSLDCALEG